MVVGVLGEAEADRIFHALADATRRDIIARVIRDDQSVSALAQHYPVSFAAVQKPVAALERAALVTTAEAGRSRSCAVTGRHFARRPACWRRTTRSGGSAPRTSNNCWPSTEEGEP